MMVEKDEKLLGELTRRMSESSIRMKDMEWRIARIERDFALISEEIRKGKVEFKSEVDAIQKKISDISENLARIGAEVEKVKKSLESAATKAEIKEFEKFIELISPTTSQFVTRDEVERMLEKELREKT